MKASRLITAHNILFLLIKSLYSFFSLHLCPSFLTLTHTPYLYKVLLFTGFMPIYTWITQAWVSCSLLIEEAHCFPCKIVCFHFGHHLHSPGCLHRRRKGDGKKSPTIGSGKIWHHMACEQDHTPTQDWKTSSWGHNKVSHPRHHP